MKLESDKYKDISIKFGNDKVKFDKDGIAEVSDEAGARIKDDYLSLLNSVDKKAEMKSPETDEELKKEVKDLVLKNTSLEERVKSLTSELVTSKNETQSWKDEYENSTNKPVDNETPQVTTGTSKQDVELVLELTKKNKGDLEAMAEELQLPKEEWDPLNKEDLIIYLAVKAIDANN